ncbi:hypothetical protein ACFPFP_02950 [Bradyrhizobium sp. GCM10023182]|uniref:Uncharacterized protein n=1 Tax=Bradyrhizobium zhengyangense TaxID=2911009 RepID=A0ABS9LFU8_9BRAD|nr:hypothetical protein [Bradyrhizobium zhengyangense]MCG2665887.1 hypothetical protein [Bradyrhizobium zhengyangense]
MAEPLEHLLERAKHLPPVQRPKHTQPQPVSPPAPIYRGTMGNPDGMRVLRIIDGKLFEDEPLGWEIYSEGQPLPVLLGHGAYHGDFAVAKIKQTAIGPRYVSVVHRGQYFDNFTYWLYAMCGEQDPGFTPRWAEREHLNATTSAEPASVTGQVTSGHPLIGG